MPRRHTALAVAALAAVAAAAPADADAISRQQATRVALRALKPQREPGRVVVFALRRPIPAGTTVGEAGPRPHSGVTRVHRKTWVFWEDLSYGALLQHPSAMLLVDDRSGQVTGRRRMQWFPIVGKRLAPFMITPAGYRTRRYKVYERTGTRRRGRSGIHMAAYPTPRPRPSDLAADCMVTIGDFDTGWPKGLRENLNALNKFADAVGLRRLNAVPNRGGLISAVDTVIGEGCRDVFIYLAGHGTQPTAADFDGQKRRVFTGPSRGRGTGGFKPVGRRSPGGPAGVNVSPAFVERRDGRVDDRSAYITPQDLIELMRNRPGVEFKLKIDSCFSGRFERVFEEAPNLLITELSSAFNEVSYFDVTPGTRLPKLNPVTKRATGDLMVDDTDNPDGATEFTNGDVHGLFEWGRDAPAGETLLEAIDASYTNGAKNNFSWLAGWTQPIIRRRARTALTTSPRATLDPGDPNEMFIRGDITRTGGRASRPAQAGDGVDAIRVIVPPSGSDPRPIVNFICPSQLPNGELSATRNPGDTLTCSGGSIPVPGAYELKVRTFPAPTPGMGGELHLRQNGIFQGPFAIAGP